MKEDAREKYERNLRALTWLTRILAPTGLLRLANQSETVIADKLPDTYQNMVESLGFLSKAYQALDEEMASFQRSQAEVRDSEPLPDVPSAVISSASLQDFPPGFSGDYMKSLWDELQADLSKLPTAQHITAADGGHYIHIDQPELVIETVIEMIKLICQ